MTKTFSASKQTEHISMIAAATKENCPYCDGTTELTEPYSCVWAVECDCGYRSQLERKPIDAIRTHNKFCATIKQEKREAAELRAINLFREISA